MQCTLRLKATKIIKLGISKPELQSKPIKIFHICKIKNMDWKTTKISKGHHQEGDSGHLHLHF